MGFAEDGGDEAAALAQLGQDFPVMAFQVAAIQGDQAGSTVWGGDGGGIADFAPFVIHFEEEEIG